MERKENSANPINPGSEENASDISKRWFYLVVSAIGLLFVGLIYGWSILKVPLKESFGWDGSALALTYTISMSFFCLGSLLAGLVSKKVSPRLLLIISAILLVSGYGVTANLSGESITALYFSYGLAAAFGIGIAYNTLLSIGNSWFPDKKGTSSGVLMMAFGLSTMVLGKTASRLFDVPSMGWRKTFMLLGIVMAVVVVICGLILHYPSPGTEFPKPQKAKRKNTEEFETRDYSAAEVIRRPAFWMFYVYGTFNASVGSVVISFANELSQHLGATVAFAATLVGVLSVFNGVGRILSGLCFDWFGRRKTMLLANTITLAATLIMLCALQLHSLPLGILSLGLTGISYGSNPTISSAFISTFYGMKDFSLNYSIGNTKLLISSFGATIAGSLLERTGSYTAPFLLLTVFAVIAFILNFMIRKP